MKKRWVILVLVSLLLGAVINIVVAWGLAGVIGVPAPPAPVVGFWNNEVITWSRPVPDGWPERPQQWSRGAWWCCTLTEHRAHVRQQQVGPDGMVLLISPIDGPIPSTDYSLNVVEWGWPMRTLDIAWSHEQSNVIAVSTFAPPTDIALRTGLPLPARFARTPWRTHLPLNPVWPWFVVNTLLYAPFAAVLLCGPGWVRTCGRSRRGECVRCGYQLAGLKQCAECGAAAQRTANRQISKAANEEAEKEEQGVAS